MTKRILTLIIAIITTTFIMAQEESLSKEANLLPDSDVLSMQKIPYFYVEGNGENLGFLRQHF